MSDTGETSDTPRRARGDGRPRIRWPRRPSRAPAGDPVEVRPPEADGDRPRDAETVAEQIRTPGGLRAGLSALGAATVGSAGTLLPGRRARDPWAGEDMWELGVDRGSMVAATDGVPLAVREAGPTDAPMTVVLVHGYTLSMDTWHFQRRHLQERFGPAIRMVFYDQRGHALSGKGSPARATIAQLAADLNSVVSATAPTGPVVVIGHSMGGMTVMAYAARYPESARERVLGVGLVSTAMAELSRSGLGAVLESKAVGRVAAFAARTPGVFTSGRRAFGAIISPFIYGGSFGDPAKVSPTVARFVDELIASTDVLTIANFFATLTEHDESAAVPVLRHIRTTVMCGDRDLLTPLDHSLDIVERLPDAEFVVVPGAGHMVMLEEPEHVSEVLGDLVADAIIEWRSRTDGHDDDGPDDQGPDDLGPGDQGPADQGPADQGPADQGPDNHAAASRTVGGTLPTDESRVP